MTLMPSLLSFTPAVNKSLVAVASESSVSYISRLYRLHDRRNAHVHLSPRQMDANAITCALAERDDILVELGCRPSFRHLIQPSLRIELSRLREDILVDQREMRRHSHWRTRRNGPVFVLNWFVVNAWKPR